VKVETRVFWANRPQHVHAMLQSSYFIPSDCSDSNTVTL